MDAISNILEKATLNPKEVGSALMKETLANLYQILANDPKSINAQEFRLIQYLLSKCLIEEVHDQLIIDEIKRKLLLFERTNEYYKLVIYVLVASSEKKLPRELLLECLNGDSFELKALVFYHEVKYPIPMIFQTKECKNVAIQFINSDEFKITYEKLKSEPVNHARLFAFPLQYINCFDIGWFSSEEVKNYSKSKLTRLVREERLESIRSIEDPNLKIELIKRYFSSYLPTTYKTTFVKLANKEFPELKLKKNGFDWLD